MSEQITLTELSKLSGRTVQFIARLIAQGRLPEGTKTWKKRYVDREACMDILNGIQKRSRQVNDGYLGDLF